MSCRLYATGVMNTMRPLLAISSQCPLRNARNRFEEREDRRDLRAL